MYEIDDAVAELIVAVFRLNGRQLDAGDQLVSELGLTSAWWQVLGALALSPVPLPVAHITRNMGLARQSVQRIVDLLAEKKLVRFAANPHHLRAKLVVLTAQGKAAVKQAEELYYKAQKGFISAQLHRGIAGSGTFLNDAVWESVGAFRAAFANPVFQAKLSGYPDGVTGSPYLFRKVAVDGVCVA